MASSPTNPPTSRSDFRRRLGYYMVGLAIGSVMAGMIYRARKAEVEREKAAAAQAERSLDAAPPVAAPTGR